jgi:hypothetical protein
MLSRAKRGAAKGGSIELLTDKRESLDAGLTRVRGRRAASLYRLYQLGVAGLLNGCNLFVNGNLC